MSRVVSGPVERVAARVCAGYVPLFGAYHRVRMERTVQRAREIAAIADPALLARLASYTPVDWHTDPRSGFRWPDSVPASAMTVAPAAGADIKFPRELSRCLHLLPLAYSLDDAAGEELPLQMLDWMTANPPGRGVNWASAMDVAMRAVSWIWALSLSRGSWAQWPRALAAVRNSLYTHGLHLERNLEYYREATDNHYVANIAGLLYLGCAMPELPEADKWVRFGLRELISEMERQVHDDGSHFEASTGYHRLVTEMLLSCVALSQRLPPARRERLRTSANHGHRLVGRRQQKVALDLSSLAPFPREFYARLSRMVRYLAVLTRADGSFPQIGDNDAGRLHAMDAAAEWNACDARYIINSAGVTATPPSTIADAEANLFFPGIPLHVEPASEVELFADAGVAVMRTAQAHVVVTCGPNGRLGKGGHGHNDKLAFELFVGGRPVIVDGGCPEYTGYPEVRNAFRSTSAHSTLCVEGEEQDPLPSGQGGLFALPQACRRRLWTVAPRTAEGWHDGFGSVHGRRLTLEDQRLVIRDWFGGGAASLIFNLAPALTADLVEHAGFVLSLVLHGDATRCRLRIEGASSFHLDRGFASAGYTRRLESTRVVVRVGGPETVSELRW